MSSNETPHWLTQVAAAANLKLDIPPNPDFATVRRGWVQAARAWKISEEEFTRRAAAQFKMEVADLSSRESRALQSVPEKTCRRFGVLPLEVKDRTIVVATADPSNTEARGEIQRNTGLRPVFRIAGPFLLAGAIDEAFRASPTLASPQDDLQALINEASESDFQVVSSDGQGMFTSLELEAPAIVKLSEMVLHQALANRASEIHIEPGKERARVRLRIDGVLQNLVDLPPGTREKLVARLKHQAIHPESDDPVIALEGEGGEEWQAHLLSTDTPYGEMLTVRLVSPGRVPTLQDLALTTSAASGIRRILSQKSGMVLVTGPARSGKTTLIYACLGALGTSKVVSLENPVELVIPGTTQVQYDPSSGLSFAETLQQLLSHNPDVIHAGEIRDLATARTALRAALTGREVLATVHAEDVVSGIRRLLDMGLAPGRLVESLSGVIALRLLRRLCPECSQPFDPEAAGTYREAMLAQASGITPVSRPVGCQACGQTGFRGQIPVAEVLSVGPALRGVMAGEQPTDEAMEEASRKDGAVPLMTSALDWVKNGETTLEEVERVLGLPRKTMQKTSSTGPALLVEDEAQDRLAISAVLKSMGFEVVEVAEGPAAIEILGAGTQRFSLMILDLTLPGTPGREVLREVRRSPLTEDLPIIVLTGSTNPQDEIDLLQEGADDYVLKPVVSSRLKARIQAVLRRSGLLLPDRA